MTVPLIIFLYLYIALLVLFAFFAFFNIYHIIRFSFWDFASFLATFFFLASTVLLLFLSFEYIRGVDWQQGIPLGLTSSSFEAPSPEPIGETDIFFDL